MKIFVFFCLVVFSYFSHASEGKKPSCQQSDFDRIAKEQIQNIQKSKTIQFIGAEAADTFVIRTSGTEVTYESYLLIDWKLKPKKPATRRIIYLVAKMNGEICEPVMPFYGVDLVTVK